MPRESRLRKVEAASGTLHHGRAPKDRGLSLAQCPSNAHGPTTTSTARRARSSKLECCASTPEIASAGAHAPRDKRRWLGVGGRSWHVTSQAPATGERLLASAVLFERAQTDHNQRGMARTCKPQWTVKRPIGPPQPRGHDGPPDADNMLPRCVSTQGGQPVGL